MGTDKKALALLKKYYLPYKAEGKPVEKEFEEGIRAGVIELVSEITHDEMIAEIKGFTQRLSRAAAAKAFLYSLSSGDMRYRTALSSLVWANALPPHTSAEAGRKKGACEICGCTHGLNGREKTDWNAYGVFRYLPPMQYGKKPDFTCAEYVLNDLRAFEKLPAVEPCEKDYDILNGIFATVLSMKPHNMDTAVVEEIRRRRFIDATGNGIHCILGVLSICGILEGGEHKGFLYGFTNSGENDIYRDGPTFYPLYYWRGKNGVNYAAVNGIFGDFCKDKLAPDKAVFPETGREMNAAKKPNSKAEQYFADGVYCIMLTNEERRYLALEDLRPEWETVSLFSVTYRSFKRTVLFFEGNVIVKVIYEEQLIDDGGHALERNYSEYDTRLETENRKMLLPLTSRGRAKPVTSANVMAIDPFGCKVFVFLKQNESIIWAGNYRNWQEIAIGEADRIKKISSDADFHEFMRYYIATCPEGYFRRIAEIKSLPHQTVSFRPGDVFRCQTDRTHYTYGLILGKTREIERWKELPALHSFRVAMMQPILVRMYDFVTTDANVPTERLSEIPLRPPEICADNDILWGTHKITAHKELEPEDVQFQFQLLRRWSERDRENPLIKENRMNLPGLVRTKSAPPYSLLLEWGFASCEIPWENVSDGVREMLREGSYFSNGVSLGASGAYCGKTLAEILEKTPGDTIRFNLLLPENRKKFNLVIRCFGMPEDCSYDDFAEKYGGITRRRYIELLKERCK